MYSNPIKKQKYADIENGRYIYMTTPTPHPFIVTVFLTPTLTLTWSPSAKADRRKQNTR